MRGATDPQRDARRAAVEKRSTARRASVTSSRSWCGWRATWCALRLEIITEKFDDGDDHRNEPDAVADAEMIQQADRSVDPAGGSSSRQCSRCSSRSSRIRSAAGASDLTSEQAATGAAAAQTQVQQEIQEDPGKADDRAGAAFPQEQPRQGVRARHRDRQHDHARRERREAAPHRVRQVLGQLLPQLSR